MARTTEDRVHGMLAEGYLGATLSGEETVLVHVELIADILDYLDPKARGTEKCHRSPIDDLTQPEIEKFFQIKEKKL